MLKKVLLACLLVSTTMVLAQTWKIVVADHGKVFMPGTDRSLRIDAHGHPHVAYGGDNLYYASFDGSTWQYEVVDLSSGVGKEASLTLDRAGNAHICYIGRVVGGSYHPLKYAYRSAAGWRVETIDTGGDNNHPSLILDSQGYPHVSYCSDAYYADYESKLKYAYRNATGWHEETVDSEGLVGEYTSFALDSLGNPHISYYGGYPNFDLRYAYEDGTGWHVQTVDGEGSVGKYTSLALDGSGYPHISYYDDTNEDLKYAYRDDSGWHVQIADAEGDAGRWTSLSLDSSGCPFISYRVWRSYNDYDLKYAYRNATGWHQETVDSPGGLYTSLAVDAAGFPHISDYDGSGRLKYSHRDETGWHTQTLDSEGSVGEYTSLALDFSGHAHVSYRDFRNGALKYAYESTTCWQSETVDTEGDVGYYTSLALDSSGNPHIGYAEHSHDFWVYDWHELRYAYRDALGWHVQVVDSDGDVGSWASLALDTLGYPHIGYYDADNSDLKYAYRDASGWHVQVVDSQGLKGAYCSLALDSSGYPHISYYDGDNYDLLYAWRDEAGWHIQTVDSAGEVGYCTSLVLDAADCPHISYLRGISSPGYDLKYAYCQEGEWDTETVTPAGHVRWWSSLGVDEVGNPHISYVKYNSGSYVLKRAYRDATSWQVETVDSDFDWRGPSPSLAVDAFGAPRISYQSRGDLKYARLIPSGSELPGALVGVIRLVSVSPNPFRTCTELSWKLGRPGLLDASVFDLSGRKVALVAEGQVDEGEQRLTWRPVGLRSGVYVLRVSMDGTAEAVQPLIYRR